MKTLVDFYLRSADAKSAMECLDLDVESWEVEDFLDGVAWYADKGVEEGAFGG